jgi:hypothetical protein
MRVRWQNLLLRCRPSLIDVKLACLAGDVMLRAAWLLELSGRRAWSLETCGNYVSFQVAQRGCFGVEVAVLAQ